jgi:hypothetical protein
LTASVDASDEVWTRIFSGTGTFYEDRGLPMHSTYQYRVTVFHDIGQLTSNPSAEVTTFGGLPRRAAKVTATAISHIIVGVSWETPGRKFTISDLFDLISGFKPMLKKHKIENMFQKL